MANVKARHCTSLGPPDPNFKLQFVLKRLASCNIRHLSGASCKGTIVQTCGTTDEILSRGKPDSLLDLFFFLTTTPTLESQTTNANHPLTVDLEITSRSHQTKPTWSQPRLCPDSLPTPRCRPNFWPHNTVTFWPRQSRMFCRPSWLKSPWPSWLMGCP